MTLSRVYVIPHGDEIISMPNEDARVMNGKIKEVTKGDDADTIAIISPHFLRVSSGVAVINTNYVSGEYKIKRRNIKGHYRVDKDLNSRILGSSRYFVETVFVTTEGRLSNFPLDFGSLIPLSFFDVDTVSVMGQWRAYHPKILRKLGALLYQAVSSSRSLISVVFSADQAHAHSRSGRYGYDPRAREYDEMIIDSIKDNDFRELANVKNEFIEGAKPDSFWLMLMFSGFVDRGNLKPVFHYYYVQRYFGMMLATAV
jgi:aromatic ring-opening dioxygenase LigB subunit